MMDKPATRAVEQFVARRLRPRRRGDPAVRVRRHAGGGRGRDRAHGSGAAGARARRASPCRATRPSACASGPGRKAAFPAVGRISPDYYCMDGTIPRKRLGEVLQLHRRDGEEIRPALPERVPRRRRQPASADPVRRERRRRAAIAPSCSPPRCWRNASRSAARSPASTASAWRRSTRCACSSGPTSSSCSTPSSAPSIRAACSIPARRCRRSRAAPSTAACTCTAAQLPHAELPRF